MTSRPDDAPVGWPRDSYTGLGGGLYTGRGGGASTLRGGGASTLRGGGLSTLRGGGLSTLRGGGLSTLRGGGLSRRALYRVLPKPVSQQYTAKSSVLGVPAVTRLRSRVPHLERRMASLNQSQGGMCICRVLGIGAGVSRECFGP